ncbi:GNAT family N-acetyltransferase [Anaerocolumna sp. AGMB13025]|uniref:GNAT family N-acetyltransferase n=1 Tax=Anaerocolumna sp. AGMB13025 TaxID=3039116 RepID=UPI00241C9598|nr:GNAT family N-acetyltransferase [Anaerocolumna sp. AGMB13025]WFR55876.1 GNAT family N-acetyltransferase [Anaerocolumna sp. AGMB13025]
MELIPINGENRQQVNDLIRSLWYSTDIIVRGEVVDTSVLEGFTAMEQEEITGFITYRIQDGECEIMSLASIKENQGTGTSLINLVKENAKQQNCTKLKLITTNDNMNALKFYQKRGFDMIRVYPNAMDISRSIKPAIPLIGEYGIPLKHEIEFEMIL